MITAAGWVVAIVACFVAGWMACGRDLQEDPPAFMRKDRT